MQIIKSSLQRSGKNIMNERKLSLLTKRQRIMRRELVAVWVCDLNDEFVYVKIFSSQINEQSSLRWWRHTMHYLRRERKGRRLGRVASGGPSELAVQIFHHSQAVTKFPTLKSTKSERVTHAIHMHAPTHVSKSWLVKFIVSTLCFFPQYCTNSLRVCQT